MDICKFKEVALAAIHSYDDFFTKYFPLGKERADTEFTLLATSLAGNPTQMSRQGVNKYIFDLHCLGSCIKKYEEDERQENTLLYNPTETSKRILKKFMESAENARVDKKNAKENFLLASRVHETFGASAVWVGGLKGYLTVRMLDRLNKVKRAEIRKFISKECRNVNVPSLSPPLLNFSGTSTPHTSPLAHPASSSPPPPPWLLDVTYGVTPIDPTLFNYFESHPQETFNMGEESGVMFPPLFPSDPQHIQALLPSLTTRRIMPDDSCNITPSTLELTEPQLDTVSNPPPGQGLMLHGLPDNCSFSLFTSQMVNSDIDLYMLHDFDLLAERIIGEVGNQK